LVDRLILAAPVGILPILDNYGAYWGIFFKLAPIQRILTILAPYIVGILYLIYPYEYAVKNKPIYKLGVHQNLEPNNSYNRYNSYEKGSEIIYYFKINNLYENTRNNR
jgi:hypothetical protein